MTQPGRCTTSLGGNGAIAAQVAPRGGEPRSKNYPNSFRGDRFEAELKTVGASNLILAGSMTRMWNRTARGAPNLGFALTVAVATATRALPGPDGPVAAAMVQPPARRAVGPVRRGGAGAADIS